MNCVWFKLSLTTCLVKNINYHCIKNAKIQVFTDNRYLRTQEINWTYIKRSEDVQVPELLIYVQFTPCVPVIPPVFSQILRSETIFCWPKINYITARKSFLWIWSHLLKKSLMENFLSSAVFSRHDNSKATSNFWIKFSEITWFSKRSIRWCIFFFPGNVPLKYFCASAMERYFRKWKQISY